MLDSLLHSLYRWFGVPVVSVIFIVVVSHMAYWRLRVGRHWPRTARMVDIGGYSGFYFCAIMQSFYMKKGIFRPVGSERPTPVTKGEGSMGSKSKVLSVYHPDVSDERMNIIDCHMFHQALQRYRNVIGFKGGNMDIPPCFMSVYFNKSLIALGSSELSRCRILGAVHIKQQVTVYQDLSPLLTSIFSMNSHADEYRITDRGVEVDITSTILDEHDIVIWEGVITGISLLPSKFSTKKTSTQTAPIDDDFVVYKEDTISTNIKTGIEFASSSEDYQPQHLYSWTAKLVGFNKPIAHGLWTMATAVEKVMRAESCYRDAYPLQIETNFRRPLVLGCSALVQFERPDGDKYLSNFRVVNPETKLPYVTGKIYVGAKIKKQ